MIANLHELRVYLTERLESLRDLSYGFDPEQGAFVNGKEAAFEEILEELPEPDFLEEWT